MDVAATKPLRRITSERHLHVGHASIDPISREATFPGGVERLRPQNLKVLVLLARRKGEVVTRDEIIEQCWDNRFVGEDVINRAISTLRQFAARAGGFEIETIPRAGYRLMETEAGGTRIKWRWPIAGAAVAALLIVIAAGWYVQDQGAAKVDAPTVAVLPMAEDSPGEDVHRLASATRASMSYALTKGGYPVALVDRRPGKLQPDLLVSGEIQRTPDSVEAFVQVEEMRHGVIVYSQRFEADRNSAPSLADQIGASVAANLSWAATLMMLDRRHPSDPAITARLLTATSEANDSVESLPALELASKLASKVPTSAIAQFTLASLVGDDFDELPRDQRPAALAAARAAASRLLTLAPDFADAYGLWCTLHDPMLLAQCEDHLRRGLAADPGAPSVTGDLGTFLNAVGREDEALQLDQIALAKDPYDPIKLDRTIRLLEEEGLTSDADQLFRQRMHWWPDRPAVYWSRLMGILARRDYAAIERFEREVGDKTPLNRNTASKVIAAARSHDRAAMIQACGADKLRWTTQFLCMTALADGGARDQAFAIANKLFPSGRGRSVAEEERMWLDQPSAFSIAVLSSPAAASLRRDPRFLALADGSGLLGYWRSGRLPDFCRAKPEPVCASLKRRT